MKNKTKRIVRIVCGVLLIVILQSIGYTYAKYITTEKGSGQADIAKWAFEIDKEGAETKNIQLVDTVNKTTLVNGKIAPGTNGTIILDITGNGSEVSMDYLVEFTNEKNKPTNLVFTYDGITYNSLSEITEIKGNMAVGTPMARRIAVNWKWNYETGENEGQIAANDAIDTKEANTIDQYTFDIVVTASQSK